MQYCNVAIVGCGLGGLATAIAIRRAGHNVTIHEKASVVSEIGAGIQLPYNCTRILKDWGVICAVEAQATRVRKVMLRTYRDGSVLCEAQVPRSIEGADEISHLLIHRGELIRIFVAEAKKLGVSIQLASRITGIDYERPSIHFMDRVRADYDAIFGADGSKSFCRSLLFGDFCGPQLSGDVAYRMTVPVETVASEGTLSTFVEDSGVSCWMGPDAHAVCYQLKESGIVNVVLIGPYNPSLNDANAQSERQEVRDLLAAWDPRLQKLLELSTSILKRRLQGSHRMESWSHPGGKFVLVGDACHTSLPTLAQGAAQAIEDAAVLGHLFQRIEHVNQIPQAIRLYEAMRRPRTSSVTAASNTRREIYQLPDGEAQQARDEGLRRESPCEGYPRCFEDPAFHSWLLNYDVRSAVMSTCESVVNADVKTVVRI